MHIQTNSRTALTVLESMTAKSIITHECHNMIRILVNERTVECLWNLLHRGIWGNEIADKLVTFVSTETTVKIYHAKVKEHILL